MVYRTSLYVVCALLMAAASPSDRAQAQAPERVGEVSEIRQSGLQLHAGSADLLDQGDPVIRNARLETDGIGEMSLAMDDGSQLVVPSNSEIAIDRFVYDLDGTVGQAVFSLARGAVRMISGRMPSNRYQMNTPVATIGLRGTDFTAEMIPGSGLFVRVDQGAVEIRPADSTDQFTVSAGQVSQCSLTECRDVGSPAGLPRQARLGPPSPRGGSARAQNSIRTGETATGEADSAASRAGAVLTGAEQSCPPYQIPDWAYLRIGLNPADWPGNVDGITFYRHTPNGVEATLYCPDRVDFAGSKSSFTVLGQANPGDTKVLYFVNAVPGQAFFQSGFDDSAKEKDDAKAYRDFMAQVLGDQPGHRIITSKANLHRAAPNQLVLQQSVQARVPDGEYLITGVTLYRSTNDGRTALFAIPAVVTPRKSEAALTALDIGRPLYQRLPDPVELSDRTK